MPEKRRGGTTVEELLRELEADPEFVRREEEREAERRQLERQLRDAEAPLLRDLADVGVDVDSAWDLVNTSTPYPDALPVLLDHLGRDYPDRVREGMARALAVRGDAAFAWATLLRLYRQEPAGTDAKDGLAVALAAVAAGSELNELTELAADARHGESRILLISGISRLRSTEAREALDRLADDPVVGTEVRRRLKRRKR
jgi:hypothetical protein